jgi:uncharacterized membrane protein YjjP (DUF1212 family)
MSSVRKENKIIKKKPNKIKKILYNVFIFFFAITLVIVSYLFWGIFLVFMIFFVLFFTTYFTFKYIKKKLKK